VGVGERGEGGQSPIERGLSSASNVKKIPLETGVEQDAVPWVLGRLDISTIPLKVGGVSGPIGPKYHTRIYYCGRRGGPITYQAGALVGLNVKKIPSRCRRARPKTKGLKRQ
jgi:hypothetical protein